MGRQRRHKQPPTGENPTFGVNDCIYNGMCIIRAEGPMATPAMMRYFREYFDRKIDAGIRFFILDCDRVKLIDSSGLGTLVAMSARASMRSGKFLLLNLDSIESVLQMTKLIALIPGFRNVEAAFQEIFKRPVTVPQFTFEERFLVTYIRQGSDLVVIKPDTSIESSEAEPSEAEPPLDESPAPVERLTIRGMAGVVLSALVVLGLMILGLVWVTKQVSSIPLLVLIFCVALLFSLCLIGLLLLLSGHLSEKMTVKLLNGVLAKIPSLGSWVPKVLARKIRI
jgi:anti-anti-sigma factor